MKQKMKKKKKRKKKRKKKNNKKKRKRRGRRVTGVPPGRSAMAKLTPVSSPVTVSLAPSNTSRTARARAEWAVSVTSTSHFTILAVIVQWVVGVVGGDEGWVLVGCGEGGGWGG